MHFLRLTISNRKCIRFFAYINIQTKIYLRHLDKKFQHLEKSTYVKRTCFKIPCTNRTSSKRICERKAPKIKCISTTSKFPCTKKKKRKAPELNSPVLFIEYNSHGLFYRVELTQGFLLGRIHMGFLSSRIHMIIFIE